MGDSEVYIHAVVQAIVKALSQMAGDKTGVVVAAPLQVGAKEVSAPNYK